MNDCSVPHQKVGCARETKSAPFEDDKNISSFIGKLSTMLQDPAAQPFVCWSFSGESILIIDPPRFSSQILPRYYKHSNFASFVRQLNLYGFHKTSQESDSCEFSHPAFRQGNEHVFKEIRRKVASQPFSDRDSSKSRSEMERMMQSIDELRNRQVEFEKALKQKDAEKMFIYQEMIQSKHRQDVLEARMSNMVGVLLKACHSIGLTPIEGDGGNNLLQILESDSTSEPPIRGQKRQRMIENYPGVEKLLSLDSSVKFQASMDGMSFIHSDSKATELLEALSAKLSSVSGNRELLLSGMFRNSSKPTLEDVTDSLESPSFPPVSADVAANRQVPQAACPPVSGGRSSSMGSVGSPYGFDEASACGGARYGAVGEGAASGGGGGSGCDHSAELDGEGMMEPSMLSPRAFDSLDCLPTEPLNSIELNLGSQCFSLDSILSSSAPAAVDKKNGSSDS